MQIINHYEISLTPLRRPFIIIQKKASAGEDVEKWNVFLSYWMEYKLVPHCKNWIVVPKN